MAIPGADQYASASVSANNAYNNALAQINQNRLNTLTQYGYTGSVDPTSGVVSGVRVDPHSIYGQLQQMLHGAAVEDQNALFAAQDRGLHGGLAHQAAAENKYQHGAALTGLGNSLQGQLAGFQNQQQSAAETKNAALYQAEQAQLDAEMQAEYNSQIQDLIKQLANGQNNGSNDNSGGGGGTNTPPPPAVSPVPVKSGDAYVGTTQVDPYTLARAFGGGPTTVVTNAEKQNAAKKNAINTIFKFK